MKFNKSMVEYVKEQMNNENYDLHVFKIWNYANFLSKPLDISYFIPCDEKGKHISFPNLTCKRPESKGFCQCGEEQVSDCRDYWNEYQTALSKMIFEGFELRCPNVLQNGNLSITFTKNADILLDKTIYGFIENIGTINTLEDLLKYNLDIKESVAKELGLI